MRTSLIKDHHFLLRSKATETRRMVHFASETLVFFFFFKVSVSSFCPQSRPSIWTPVELGNFYHSFILRSFVPANG